MENGGSDLYRRFQAGDEDAFRELVSRHEAALRARLAAQLPASMQRRVSVADVLQETWVVAHRRRGDFEDRGANAFAPWVGGIADKKLQEEIRRHGRTAKRAAAREVTRGDRPDTHMFAGRTPTPSAIAVSAEELAHIRDAMTELREDYRRVIGLALENGLSLAEAAEVMGRSRDAVKKLYGRAMVQLRQVLDERSDGA